jgi:hypothetical protein
MRAPGATQTGVSVESLRGMAKVTTAHSTWAMTICGPGAVSAGATSASILA